MKPVERIMSEKCCTIGGRTGKCCGGFSVKRSNPMHMAYTTNNPYRGIAREFNNG